VSTRKAYDLPGLEPVVEKDTAARVSRRRYPVMMNYVITEVPQVHGPGVFVLCDSMLLMSVF
jgi:hypothetical protein